VKCFALQVAIIIGAGLVTGFGFTLTSKLPPKPTIVDRSKDGPPAHPPSPTGPTGVTGPTGATGTTGAIPDKPVAKAPAPSDVDKISLTAAKTLFDQHNAVFIDARAKKEYLESHIPGAMQLEKSDLDSQPPAKVLNYLPGMEIVVYCHGELCTDSEAVIRRLMALNKGIGPMHIIADGFPGWQKAGYPAESGPESGFQ
jgi:rhodanese-related sulfurtransferase